MPRYLDQLCRKIGLITAVNVTLIWSTVYSQPCKKRVQISR
jgi:hypothetical protein